MHEFLSLTRAHIFLEVFKSSFLLSFHDAFNFLQKKKYNVCRVYTTLLIIVIIASIRFFLMLCYVNECIIFSHSTRGIRQDFWRIPENKCINKNDLLHCSFESYQCNLSIILSFTKFSWWSLCIPNSFWNQLKLHRW